MPMPLAIEALDKPEVKITWEDGFVQRMTPRQLRCLCACAYCIEEMTGRPILDPATVPEDVRVKAIELVGQYAIAVQFSDGHQTGIYSFDRLRKQA